LTYDMREENGKVKMPSPGEKNCTERTVFALAI
jgi:hypothetical protein